MSELTIQENVPLAPLTTFEVGGPARYFAEVRTEEEGLRALEFAEKRGVPLLTLGGGSNILIADEGFPGLVIRNKISGFEGRSAEDSVAVRVGAGEDWDETVARAVREGWAGIECLSGIPGSVGGAVVQNIGAYGQTLSEVVREVRAIDCAAREIRDFRSEECAFEYRGSLFKKQPGRHLITAVTLALVPHGAPSVTYHDVKNYFGDRRNPTLGEVRRAVLEIRAGKGAVMLPAYERYKSAGSFLKNPVVPAETFPSVKARIEQAAARGGCAPPWYWELPSGEVKIAAACLLERAGFKKGYGDGAVGISPKHALTVINRGGATAADVVAFAKRLIAEVKKQFGVALEAEVQRVGFARDPLARE